MALTVWRTPGYDAVFVAGLTLIPIGLAIAPTRAAPGPRAARHLKAGDQAPVLVVYATVTTIVTPIGGLLIGAIADELSLWGAPASPALVITLLALGLRRRLRVFDELGAAPDRVAEPALHRAHLHLMHVLGCEMPGSHADHFHISHHEPLTPTLATTTTDEDHAALVS